MENKLGKFSLIIKNNEYHFYLDKKLNSQDIAILKNEKKKEVIRNGINDDRKSAKN